MTIPPHLLRRLDYCPTWLALPVGFGIGALLAVTVLLWTPAVLGATLFVLLLGGAALLASSGEPVAVLVRAPEPEPPLEPPLPSAMMPALPPELPGLEMVRIPGGVFRMGSPADEAGRFDNEGPVHEVRVSAFTMMRVPVTRHLYLSIMQPETSLSEADEHPMTRVSWFAAVQFCNRLSQHQGLSPCYQIDGTNVQWDHDATGYRLPTEAEWEYACRAGTQSRWSWGDDERLLERYAWYAANSGGSVQPVGRKAPNPWGLHDMHGNVWEWCGDWHGPYGSHVQTNPTGPLAGRWRVLRGGSFFYPPEFLRSACRDDGLPVDQDDALGFRCVRVPPQL